MPNPLYESFHKMKLSEVIKGDEKVFTLAHDSLLEDAVKAINEHKVLSIFVTKDGKVMGAIDMLDIASWILSVHPEDKSVTLEMASRAMHLKKVEDCLNKSGRDPIVPLNSHDPVSEAIQMFKNGVHRVAVIDEKEKLVGIFSQSDLAAHMKEDKFHKTAAHVTVMNKKIGDLGLGQTKPVSSNLTDLVIDILRKLDGKSVSAVPLVGEDGKLAGNFSASDLKGMFSETLPSYGLSAKDYLTKHSEKSLTPSSVAQESTLLECIKEMSFRHTHRVWVVDGEKKPSGVVSLTDLAKLVIDYDEE